MVGQNKSLAIEYKKIVGNIKLPFIGYTIKFFLTPRREDWVEFLRDINVPEERIQQHLEDEVSALTAFQLDCRTIGLMFLNETLTFAILAHEVRHAIDFIREGIGQENPTEYDAYLTEYIIQEVIHNKELFNTLLENELKGDN